MALSRIKTNSIADSAVTGSKISDGAVVAADIAALSVDSTKLASNAVTTAKIADNNITTAKIVDNSITYAKLSSDIQRSGMRNRIINGDMRIDQRNAGAAISSLSGTTYTVDRFFYQTGQAGRFSGQQNQGSVTPPTGFTKYYGLTSLGANSPAAGDYGVFSQAIEGVNIADLAWGTANAKPVTVSFWVYSSLAGTHSIALVNNGSNRSYSQSYTITSVNTWQQILITIPGDTTGTWNTDNAAGIFLRFPLSVGSSNLTTAGSWLASNSNGATGTTAISATSGATFYITGVQLEAGSTATNFEYRQYGTELVLCQRYCQVLGGNLYVTGMAFSANRVLGGMPYINCMRAAPTVTIAANGYSYFTAGAAQVSSAIAAGANPNSSTISLDVTVTASTGVPGVGQTTATTVSAEL